MPPWLLPRLGLVVGVGLTAVARPGREKDCDARSVQGWECGRQLVANDAARGSDKSGKSHPLFHLAHAVLSLFSTCRVHAEFCWAIARLSSPCDGGCPGGRARRRLDCRRGCRTPDVKVSSTIRAAILCRTGVPSCTPLLASHSPGGAWTQTALALGCPSLSQVARVGHG